MLAIDIDMPRNCAECPFLSHFEDEFDDMTTYCELATHADSGGYIDDNEAVRQIFKVYKPDEYGKNEYYSKEEFAAMGRPAGCGLREVTPQNLAELQELEKKLDAEKEERFQKWLAQRELEKRQKREAQEKQEKAQ